MCLASSPFLGLSMSLEDLEVPSNDSAEEIIGEIGLLLPSEESDCGFLSSSVIWCSSERGCSTLTSSTSISGLIP